MPPGAIRRPKNWRRPFVGHRNSSARRALPKPGPIGRWVSASSGRALALAAVMPHVVATVVNIAYNDTQIQFTTPAQKRAFLWVILGYNSFAYPVCVGTACWLCWRIAQALRRRGVDDARRYVRQLGWWAIGLAALGWLPGGVVFPLAIDLAAGPVGWPVYAHFIVSFTLAGLIGVVFSYLAIEYVSFRALFPRLGNPDGFTRAKSLGRAAALDRTLRLLPPPGLRGTLGGGGFAHRPGRWDHDARLPASGRGLDWGGSGRSGHRRAAHAQAARTGCGLARVSGALRGFAKVATKLHFFALAILWIVSRKYRLANDFRSSPSIISNVRIAAQGLQHTGPITTIAREPVCAEWNDTARPLGLGPGAAKHPRTQVVRMGVP